MISMSCSQHLRASLAAPLLRFAAPTFFGFMGFYAWRRRFGVAGFAAV
jgi:hypothetical protein